MTQMKATQMLDLLKYLGGFHHLFLFDFPYQLGYDIHI